MHVFRRTKFYGMCARREKGKRSNKSNVINFEYSWIDNVRWFRLSIKAGYKIPLTIFPATWIIRRNASCRAKGLKRCTLVGRPCFNQTSSCRILAFWRRRSQICLRIFIDFFFFIAANTSENVIKRSAPVRVNDVVGTFGMAFTVTGTHRRLARMENDSKKW